MFMQLTIELLNEDPKDFQPTFETVSNHILGSFKVNKDTTNETFPFNPETKDWLLKIIYDDYKFIKGIGTIPTKNNIQITSEITGTLNYLPIYFIISKSPIGDRKKPVVWQSPFFSQMTQNNFDSLDRFFGKYFNEIIERTRIHKASQSIKKQIRPDSNS
jgi:hypothetical protein